MVSGMKLVKVTKINQVTEEPPVVTSYNDLTDKPDLSNLHAPHSDDQTIPTALSDLSDDSTHRVVTDTEKTTWNGKSDASHIHTGTLIFTYFT